jgi:hypothetical protein
LEEEAVCWQEEGGGRAVYHLVSLTPEALESVLFQMAPYCGGGGGGGELPSKESRRELVYNTMKANSFGSSGGSLRGLFPVLCLSNSSCDPCASAEEVGREGVEGPVYSLQARRAIAAGEEITISYCPRAWNKPLRSKEFQEAWGFTCKCARCISPYDDTIIHRCSSCKGGLVLKPDIEATSPCLSCGVQAPFAVEDGCETLEPQGEVEGWGLENWRAYANTLLTHPTIALDDARCFTALSRAFWAVHEFGEDGNGLKEQLLEEVVKVCMRSKFVCLQDLGIEVEED